MEELYICLVSPFLAITGSWMPSIIRLLMLLLKLLKQSRVPTTELFQSPAKSMILKTLLQKPVCKKFIPSIKFLHENYHIFWPFLLVERYMLHIKLVKMEYCCSLVAYISPSCNSLGYILHISSSNEWLFMVSSSMYQTVKLNFFFAL